MEAVLDAAMNIVVKTRWMRRLMRYRKKFSARKISVDNASTQVEYDQQRLNDSGEKTPEGSAGCKSAGRTELPGATDAGTLKMPR
ncbi:hypothetical protein ACULNC_26470 [Shigella flexneri]